MTSITTMAWIILLTVNANIMFRQAGKILPPAALRQKIKPALMAKHAWGFENSRLAGGIFYQPVTFVVSL
jgi:hypothetical protein